jgi:hypothetical protein
MYKMFLFIGMAMGISSKDFSAFTARDKAPTKLDTLLAFPHRETNHMDISFKP